MINSNKFLPEMIEDIRKELSGKIKGTEVGVNLISGSGKELPDG